MTPKPVVERRLEVVAILAALATVPVVILQAEGADLTLVYILDWIIWGIFALEYVVLMIRSDNRWRTTREQWLSIAIIVVSFPFLATLFYYLRLLRLLRLARLVRLVLIAKRGVHAFKVVLARNEVLYVAGLTVFLVFVGAGILSIVEPQWGGFWISVWWAIDTTTTLGYGEVLPQSVAGRVTAVALLLSGIGLVATLAAALASYFVKDDEAEKEAQIQDIQDRLERIEQLLLQQAQNGASPELTLLESPEGDDPSPETEPAAAG